MDKKISHVCFVAPAIYPIIVEDRSIPFIGGAEVQQSIIARGLRDAGYRVSIVTGDFGQPDEMETEGIRIVKIIRRGLEIPGIRYFHPQLTSIWNAVKRADADLYYQRCAGAATAVVGLFARKYNRSFIYAGAHDLDFARDQTRRLFRGKGGWRNRQLYYRGLRLADAIIAQHEGQAESCRHWYGRNADVIPSCYSLPAGSTASRTGAVLWVSTLRGWKRPELFLDLARSLPHLNFKMIGGSARGADSEVFTRIKAEADKLPNVEFVGFVPYADVEKYFDDACLFVNTSEWEGFPNTFLQAWARGIPTVSFLDVNSKKDGQSVGSTVIDMEEMKQTVERFCSDPELWEREGARARAYFTTKHSVSATVELYGRVFDRLSDR